MDYRELIEVLRTQEDRVVLQYIEDAATAIETLLAEREAAAEDLRGKCTACAHAYDSFAEEPCKSCKNNGHAPDIVFCDMYPDYKAKDSWQWRGPKKGE